VNPKTYWGGNPALGWVWHSASSTLYDAARLAWRCAATALRPWHSDLGFNPAVVSRALTKLAKAGLIDRRIDSGDSRPSRLELTKEGLRTNAAIAARIRPGLAQRLQRLNAHQIQTLLETFAILTADPVEST
jgi:hypothetical protein